MFDSSVIFQRTHSGRVEIHEKKKGLTQSERLVLIMVDGASSYSGVRAKLPVLTDDRFQRAIGTLLQKELISEVFMPLEGQAPEEVDRTVVDRFLQQDPLDPVTIIMMDDDERLDSLKNVPQAPDQSPSPAPPADVSPPIVDTGSDTRSSSDGPAANFSSEQEEDERETEEILKQIRANQSERPQPSTAQMFIPPQPEPRPPNESRFPTEGATWIYWGLTVAGAFMLGYALARVTL